MAREPRPRPQLIGTAEPPLDVPGEVEVTAVLE
jgi:hypothetical protein